MPALFSLALDTALQAFQHDLLPSQLSAPVLGGIDFQDAFLRVPQGEPLRLQQLDLEV
jgi:hypothetical protein